MLERLADSAAVAAPFALTCASVVVAGRLRSGRRRERLNRALHELRRPLQALALAASRPAGAGRADHLALALHALDGLDHEINGGAAERDLRPVDVLELVEQALARWRPLAARSGRRIELRWSANGSRVVGAAAAIAQALDNLIANALEHGSGPVRVEATARAGRLRLMVADGLAGDTRPAFPAGNGVLPRRRDPRRGHGLRIVADVAARHGGRFAACRHGGGVTAVVELPLI